MNNLKLTPDSGQLDSDLPLMPDSALVGSDLDPRNVDSGLRLTPDISKLFEVDPMCRQYESALARTVRQFCLVRDKIIETDASLDAFTLRRVSFMDG